MTETHTAPRGAGRLSARLKLALALTAFGGFMTVPFGDEPSAKTPGARYCFLKVCHRVLTLEETRARVGKPERIQASFYDSAGRDRFNPSNITSSGEYFRAGRPDNAASPIYPNGTKVLVWNPATRRAVVVRINNAGPYYGRRLIDLSRGAAEKLGIRGVGTVVVKVLEAPTRAEATYRRGRTYPPVPGYLGSFGSPELAFLEAGRALGRRIPVDTIPAPSIVVAANDLPPPPELGSYEVAPAGRAASTPASPLADPSIAGAEIPVAAAAGSPTTPPAAAALASVAAPPAPSRPVAAIPVAAPATPVVAAGKVRVATAEPERAAPASARDAGAARVKAVDVRRMPSATKARTAARQEVAKAPHPSRQLAAAERPRAIAQPSAIRTAAVARRMAEADSDERSSGIEMDLGRGIPKALATVH